MYMHILGSTISKVACHPSCFVSRACSARRLAAHLSRRNGTLLNFGAFWTRSSSWILSSTRIDRGWRWNRANSIASFAKVHQRVRFPRRSTLQMCKHPLRPRPRTPSGLRMYTASQIGTTTSGPYEAVVAYPRNQADSGPGCAPTSRVSLMISANRALRTRTPRAPDLDTHPNPNHSQNHCHGRGHGNGATHPPTTTYFKSSSSSSSRCYRDITQSEHGRRWE